MKYLLLVILSVSSYALAGERPTLGLLHNTKDNGSLRFECEGQATGLLRCDFVQLAVRRKLEPAEVEARLEGLTKGWPDSLAKEYGVPPDRIMESKQMVELCKLAKDVVSAYSGSTSTTDLPPEAVASFLQHNSLQRKDISEQMSAILESCIARNLDGFKKSLRLGLIKDSHTCKVSVNPFQQTFRPVPDAKGIVTWVVADQTPSGECGFVQLSRFRPAPGVDKKLGFWQYVAKRATANPEATSPLQSSCGEWDESETLYDWKPKEIALQCDYIEPSVF